MFTRREMNCAYSVLRVSPDFRAKVAVTHRRTQLCSYSIRYYEGTKRAFKYNAVDFHQLVFVTALYFYTSSSSSRSPGLCLSPFSAASGRAGRSCLHGNCKIFEIKVNLILPRRIQISTFKPACTSLSVLSLFTCDSSCGFWRLLLRGKAE